MGVGRDCLVLAPVLKVRRLNKAQIRTWLSVRRTLCHCEGSRPEQQREEGGGGGKQEAMDVTGAVHDPTGRGAWALFK